MYRPTVGLPVTKRVRVKKVAAADGVAAALKVRPTASIPRTSHAWKIRYPTYASVGLRANRSAVTWWRSFGTRRLGAVKSLARACTGQRGACLARCTRPRSGPICNRARGRVRRAPLVLTLGASRSSCAGAQGPVLGAHALHRQDRRSACRSQDHAHVPRGRADQGAPTQGSRAALDGPQGFPAGKGGVGATRC